MLFHSLEYAALLLGCAILCTLLPRDRRWIVLLAASGIFYAAWRIEYYALLLLTAASCHLAARRIADSADSATRWRWMFLAVGLNVGILFLFKYYGLFAGTAAAWTGWALPLDLGFLLPVGISFYTFQAIGYVADVYARRIEPERSLWRTVLFVSFFPQLVAGPIERAGRLLPALRRPVIVRWSNIRVGAWMFLWGMFKKVVIADRLALLVDAVFDDVSGQAPAMAVAAVIAFWFQIYCDFSGYTDMARGSARMFGIDLMQNFRVPYLATSLHDFWSRWHISLSTWFRDYVYIPLGGNRVPPVRWAVNILVVFAVSGLWHGANWTYLIWGVLHGAALIAEVLAVWAWRRCFPIPRVPSAVARGLGWVWAFHWVALGWVFFRSASLEQAVEMIHLFPSMANPWEIALPPVFSRFELAVAVLALVWMVAIEVPTQGCVELALLARPRMVVQFVVWATLLLVLNFGIFSHPQQFVYFQF